MDFQGLRCYIEKEENPFCRRQTRCHATYTASVIRRMAARNNVTASVSENDLFRPSRHTALRRRNIAGRCGADGDRLAAGRPSQPGASGAPASAVSARNQAVTFDPLVTSRRAAILRNPVLYMYSKGRRAQCATAHFGSENPFGPSRSFAFHDRAEV